MWNGAGRGSLTLFFSGSFVSQIGVASVQIVWLAPNLTGLESISDRHCRETHNHHLDHDTTPHLILALCMTSAVEVDMNSLLACLPSCFPAWLSACMHAVNLGGSSSLYPHRFHVCIFHCRNGVVPPPPPSLSVSLPHSVWMQTVTSSNN